MRASFRRRTTAAFAALLLLIPSAGEALGATCIHHDSGGVEVGVAGHGELGGDDRGTAHEAHQSHDEHREHQECNCAGTCHAGSTTATPTTSAAGLTAGEYDESSVAPAIESGDTLLLLPYVLPYGQAPPERR